ncbi:adenosylcobinamide-GDP ribazoletransferase [Zoogloea sp.]|uniref:adenosylcobinamide-GDP ribazoletransferase n=1 Tax=Zoogloea sp. TaxID=49181 RepID=UPI0026130796|nr:adenosylcobinamide-GDP ribazoletransferase [Zoogloea sp.]MDD3352452.1 adenosylcobinamide-GDP ribazoletransferase [Zoogloea sp.]
MRQLELFFIALGFFTRLPVPGWVVFRPEKLGQAARFLPLVGWIIGLAGALTYGLVVQVLPVEIAIVLSMALTIRLTGAFHEDGWADTCDGLGGGWTREQVLAIMKDSRIGSYGTIGLVLLLLAKYLALSSLASQEDYPVIAALLVAHPLSRLAAVAVMALLDYARSDDSSKSAPVARRPTALELGVATLAGVLPLLLLSALEALGALLAVAIVVIWSRRTYARRLGGYTGDCLGATQQLAELGIYLGVLAAWSFT